MKKWCVIFLYFSGCQLISPPPKAPVQEPEKKQEPAKETRTFGLFISGAGANTFAVLPLLELIQNQSIRFEVSAGTGWGAYLAGFYSKSQNVDNLKWNLLKLNQQGVFGTKWFGNKKKRIKILRSITEEFLSSPLNTAFACPVLSKRAKLLLLKEKQPALAVLNCLQGLPPLFFSFFKKGGKGSLFSAGPLLEYVRQKVDVVIWIKPSLSLRSLKRDPAFYLFWQELKAYLNRQEKLLEKEKNLIIIKTKGDSFSVDKFSSLNAIIKTPVLLSEQKKIQTLSSLL